MPVRTSTIGAAWAPVTITTTEDDLIVVAPDGGGEIPGHLGGAIDVAGATLVVGAVAGNVPPTAHIFDPFWSLTWLAGVYGDAVAEEVKELARDPENGAREAVATYGYLSDTVVRLGIATWLHRWWPSGNPDLNVAFSVELLELEIGALRWLAEAAFIETGPIERVLRPHLEVLHSSYEWNRYRDHRGPGQELVEEVLTVALRGVVDTVAENVPGYEACADLLEAIDAGAQLSTEDYYLFAEMLEAHRLQQVGTVRGLSGVKGEDSTAAETPEGSWTSVETSWVTADIRDLPPRCLADVEGNVEWSVETAGSRSRISVSAIAAPALRAGESPTLMARAFLDGVPVMFDLSLTAYPDGALFQGSAELPPEMDPGPAVIEVGVFHPSWAGGARVAGAALEEAARERGEITQVLLGRYARIAERLAQLERTSDPSERPTAAEIVARFREQ